MARPLFIICSEFGVVDRYSNSVSAINIIESVQIFTQQDADQSKDAVIGLKPSIRLRIVATWISDDEDRKHEYEHEMRLLVPGKDWTTLHSGSFRWTAQNHRFIVDLNSFGPEKGTCLIVHAIRRAGETSEWLTQQFEITVESPGVPSATD